MNSAKNNSAYYLLGFSPQQVAQASMTVPPILAQLRIENCVSSGIVAWYRAIERQEFEGPEAARNLADLNWLTPRVLAHESVVAKLTELYPFYPARFGCLFSSLELLAHFTAGQCAILLPFFATAAERQEWGIKFTTDLDRATATAAASKLASENAGVSGANYLKLKQLQRTLRHPVLQQLHQECDERIEILREEFHHVVVRPSRALGQPDRETLLANVALWLTDHQSEQLVAICEQWNQSTDPDSPQATVATITGPWPPYSFCPSLGEAQTQIKAA